jgi:hypothetical protein
MGILGTFRNMLPGRPQAQEIAEPAPIKIDATLAPGRRVHHEYFTADEADANGKWSWLARVYADNGAVNEQRGAADSQDLARNAALTWCARVKESLGGEA